MSMYAGTRTPCLRRLHPSHSLLLPRLLSTPASARRQVKIVEVGPRDGLQNEKQTLPTELKISLIEKLVDAGLRDVEAGSFVSPKWVPQMASTSEVLSSPILRTLRNRHPTLLSLPVLVPNARGLQSLFTLLDSPPHSDEELPITSEIALFVSASEGFAKANLNMSISQSLAQLPPIIEQAKGRGMAVRAYVSVVLGCPFEGRVDGKQVAEVTKELLDMGAYEVSLGDTIGVGTPGLWEELLGEVTKKAPIEKLAAHCHDTYGTGVANVLRCVELGIPTVDSSISALGGCPYSPGATGNVSTEDVVYALESSGYSTGLLPAHTDSSKRWDDLAEAGERRDAFEKLAEVGKWVSQRLGRPNGSRAGQAALKRRERREKVDEKAKL
ncbi:hypothetical protein BCR35DRAFT_307692 [Leucosporidium creatinivorum]|uniref:hydroxymethylglutaryl-CoA lyase n=1 Tax=Leucosporidium creatinivorum TaxID=106004 RepID=A0A1Y2ELI9_9BASI|nr:hypothetical protein BCR35DRAFT_307692 [Leucosporidium creatinivorum]